jgi:hypothetical protein
MRVKKRDFKKILPNKKVYMKKFLDIYLGFFIALPIAFCIVIYLIGCFMTWSIIEVPIDWFFIRAYMIMALVMSFFMSIDE